MYFLKNKKNTKKRKDSKITKNCVLYIQKKHQTNQKNKQTPKVPKSPTNHPPPSTSQLSFSPKRSRAAEMGFTKLSPKDSSRGLAGWSPAG